MSVQHDSIGLHPYTRRGYRVFCDGCPATSSGALRREDVEAKARKEGFQGIAGEVPKTWYWFCKRCWERWPAGLKASEFVRRTKACK